MLVIFWVVSEYSWASCKNIRNEAIIHTPAAWFDQFRWYSETSSGIVWKLWPIAYNHVNSIIKMWTSGLSKKVEYFRHEISTVSQFALYSCSSTLSNKPWNVVFHMHRRETRRYTANHFTERVHCPSVRQWRQCHQGLILTSRFLWAPFTFPCTAYTTV